MGYRKRPEHNPDNYLKAILESIDNYNAYERLDVSSWLFEGYKRIEDVKEKTASKKAIFLEIVSKWIQLFEDLAIICLMFSGGALKYKGKPLIDPIKLPYEIYSSHVKNQTILKFYKIAKKGFSKSVISRVYAYKTAKELLKEGVISPKEYPYFKKQIDALVNTAQKNFKKVGKVYSRRKTKKDSGYGNLVKTYFLTKHGFKVLHNTLTSKLLWKTKETDIVLIKGTVNWGSGRKIMTTSLYEELKSEDIKLLFKQMKEWSDVINGIAGAHLRRLGNPNFLVPMIRKIKTEEIIKTKKLKIGRNDSCPCDSGLKYKKCCL